MDELKNQHRREQKDLQSRITQSKKNSTKKTRKGINEECEKLQAELNDRQRREVAGLSSSLDAADTQSKEIEEEVKQYEDETLQSNGTAAREFSDANSVLDSPSVTRQPIKKTSRQKARLARRAAEQEAQAVEAAEEAAKLPDLRKQEMEKMQEHFEMLGFKEVSIRPDGHCMYSAVAMLLQDTTSQNAKLKTGGVLSYQAVRVETARFIAENPQDFEPFLEEPIDQYTNKIKNTTEWGGQLELQAIARVYGSDINVLQADGRVEKIESGSKGESEPIWLTYYRHSFGLGEHYNALRKIP